MTKRQGPEEDEVVCCSRTRKNKHTVWALAWQMALAMAATRAVVSLLALVLALRAASAVMAPGKVVVVNAARATNTGILDA